MLVTYLWTIIHGHLKKCEINEVNNESNFWFCRLSNINFKPLEMLYIKFSI